VPSGFTEARHDHGELQNSTEDGTTNTPTRLDLLKELVVRDADSERLVE